MKNCQPSSQFSETYSITSRSGGLEFGVTCAWQAMSSLGLLAKTTGQTVTEIMEPHKDVLQDMIPPKKHLLRHQPLNAQIGLMVRFSAGLVFWVGNTRLFCWPLAAQTGLVVRCYAGLILWVGNADLGGGVNRSLTSAIVVVNFN